MLLDSTDRALFRRIGGLSWPIVVSNLLELTVGVVDFLMVRPFGPSATAALGMSRQVTFLVEGAAVAISAGVIPLVSQAVGAQRGERVREILSHSIRMVLLLAVPTTLAGMLLARPILMSMGAGEETLAHGVPYLRIYFAGVVFLWVTLIGAAIFRGAGDVWTPLKLALGVSVLNVVFNYACIFGLGPLPAFDVPGAAIATSVARGFGALACVAILFRGTRYLPKHLVDGGTAPDTRWNWSQMGRILRIGTPMALAGWLRNGSRLVFIAIVSVGAARVSMQAAVGVGMQLRLISILPALAFQVATATLVGQAIGRGDFQEAEAIWRRSAVLLGAIVAVVSAVIMILATPLTELFIASSDTAELGAKVLGWFAAAQFFSALSIGLQGALMGAGDTTPALRYTVWGQWVVMIPLAYVLMTLVGWDPDGALAAWTMAPAITLVLTWRRLQSGTWKTSRAVM